MSLGEGSYGITPWGEGLSLEQTAVGRILAFTRNDQFSALMRFLGARGDLLKEQILAIVIAFDLDTAVGVQLTRIGEIVQRPRDGMEDERYRRVLKAWVAIILSSQGDADTLHAVVRAITGFAAPEYSESYPKSFTIGAFVDADEVSLLAELIRNAKDWGTLGTLVVYPPGAEPPIGEGGGVLLGDLVGDAGLWSLVTADETFEVIMSSTGADDRITDQDGVLDGTTFNATFTCRNFDGVTNRIDWLTSIDDLSLPQPFTVALWMRAETLAGLRILWTAQQVTGPSQCMILRTNGSSLDFAHAYAAGTSLQRTSTAVLSAATWTHVAVAFPGTGVAGDVHLYINGVEAAYIITTNGSGTPRTAAGPWSIGGRIESDANCFDGDICDVRAWPRILGPDEINHVYTEAIEAGSGSFAGPPPVGPASPVDNPGVGDLVTPTYALAYPSAILVTV